MPSKRNRSLNARTGAWRILATNFRGFDTTPVSALRNRIDISAKVHGIRLLAIGSHHPNNESEDVGGTGAPLTNVGIRPWRKGICVSAAPMLRATVWLTIENGAPVSKKQWGLIQLAFPTSTRRECWK